MDPLDTPSPNDSGTDTLERYAYQAHLGFQHCLDCVAGGQTVSVTVEHIEDLVLEYRDSWIFAQIKTRNADLGPWRLTSAIPGLRSLHRAYASCSAMDASFRLYLEGAVASGDRLLQLVPPVSIDQSLVDHVAGELDLDSAECQAFLECTSVHPNQPARETIAAHNLRMLGQHSGSASHLELEAAYMRMISGLVSAMGGHGVFEPLTRYSDAPDAVEPSVREEIERKRFSAERIRSLLGVTIAAGPGPLLSRYLDPTLPPPTDLERKLLSSGATAEIIERAKVLRANASRRIWEYRASGISSADDNLEDVFVRLETEVWALVATNVGREAIGNHVWAAMLDTLRMRPADFDPRRVFSQDGFLLMGAVCEASDECRISWGGASAD